jgi:hypothetical protein
MAGNGKEAEKCHHGAQNTLALDISMRLKKTKGT